MSRAHAAHDAGPVSAFVRTMRVKLILAVHPSFPESMQFLLFACGPARPDGGHDHACVAPGFDKARRPRGAGFRPGGRA